MAKTYRQPTLRISLDFYVDTSERDAFKRQFDGLMDRLSGSMKGVDSLMNIQVTDLTHVKSNPNEDESLG